MSSDIAGLRAQLLGMVEGLPIPLVEQQRQASGAAIGELLEALKSSSDRDVTRAVPLLVQANEDMDEILDLLVASAEHINGYANTI